MCIQEGLTAGQRDSSDDPLEAEAGKIWTQTATLEDRGQDKSECY